MILNESIKVKKFKKLRDNIHDIVVELNDDKWLTPDELSNKLKKFNTNIPGGVLLKILSNWKNNKPQNIFNDIDDTWLYFDDDNNIVINTQNFDQKPTLGKSRRKLEKKHKKLEKEKVQFEKGTLIKKSNIHFNNRKSIISPLVIVDTFKDITDLSDIEDVILYLTYAVTDNKVNLSYEDLWKYMTDNCTKSVKNGGLGLYIDEESWLKHKPSSKWVIPSVIDFDILIPIWYFKYGKGTIKSIDYIKNTISVDFDNESLVKILKIEGIIKSEVVRILKRHIKKPITIEGYDILYISKIKKGNLIYHNNRGEGIIHEIPFNLEVKDKIKFKFDKTIVSVFVKELLSNQRFSFKSDQPFIKNNFTSNNNNQNYGRSGGYGYDSYYGYNDSIRDDNYIVVKPTEFSDMLKVGDIVMFGNYNMKSEVISIDHITKYMKIKKISNDYILKGYFDYFISNRKIKLSKDIYNVRKDNKQLDIFDDDISIDNGKLQFEGITFYKKLKVGDKLRLSLSGGDIVNVEISQVSEYYVKFKYDENFYMYNYLMENAKVKLISTNKKNKDFSKINKVDKNSYIPITSSVNIEIGDEIKSEVYGYGEIIDIKGKSLYIVKYNNNKGEIRYSLPILKSRGFKIKKINR